MNYFALSLYLAALCCCADASAADEYPMLDKAIAAADISAAESLASNALDQLHRNKTSEQKLETFIAVYEKYLKRAQIRRVLVIAIDRSHSQRGGYTYDAVPLLVRLGHMDISQRRISFKRAIKATEKKFGKGAIEVGAVLHQIVVGSKFSRKTFVHIKKAQWLLAQIESPEASRYLADVNYYAGRSRLYFGSSKDAANDLEQALEYFTSTPEIENSEIAAHALAALAYEQIGDDDKAYTQLMNAAMKRTKTGDTGRRPIIKPRLNYDSVDAVPNGPGTGALTGVNAGGASVKSSFSNGGKIVYRLVLDELGRVTDATIISQSAFGRHYEAAQSAVIGLRFIPDIKDGKLAQETEIEYGFNFRN
ncbi:MAG: hypothetical protein HWE25_16030 [Alphaproteobacteria bacterium]|nr:hypothetical protein [Alphaproteobacteria bacterium]